jgi:hypothetical protein
VSGIHPGDVGTGHEDTHSLSMPMQAPGGGL